MRLCSRGSMAGPGPGIWDLGQWMGRSLTDRVTWEVFWWPARVLREDAVYAGPSLGRLIVVPVGDKGGKGALRALHVATTSRLVGKYFWKTLG